MNMYIAPVQTYEIKRNYLPLGIMLSFYLMYNTNYTFPHIKALEIKLTLPYIGQCQPRVIIFINILENEFPTLHAKFQNQTSGSEEKALNVLTYGYDNHLCHLI